MKVITKGKVPELAVSRLNCDRCGTIFECTSEDHRPSLDQRPEGTYIVYCPLAGCGKRAFVRAPY